MVDSAFVAGTVVILALLMNSTKTGLVPDEDQELVFVAYPLRRVPYYSMLPMAL